MTIPAPDQEALLEVAALALDLAETVKRLEAEALAIRRHGGAPDGSEAIAVSRLAATVLQDAAELYVASTCVLRSAIRAALSPEGTP
jgi:hypothetical protein